jgi:hypothetical protein
LHLIPCSEDAVVQLLQRNLGGRAWITRGVA